MRECADRDLDCATALSVLMVEDSADDAQLNALQLEAAGYELHWERVEDAGAMVSALERGRWDLVLCDHQMPQLDAFGALDVLREIRLGVPCVVVTGTVGDEAAAGVMRAGAADFLSKDNLERLGFVVDRCLREADAHRARKAAEELVAVSEGRFRAALETMPDAFAVMRPILDDNGEIVDFAADYVNAAMRELAGLSRPELEAARLLESFPAPLAPRFFDAFRRVVQTGVSLSDEQVSYADPVGAKELERILEVSAEKMGGGCLAVTRDITERTQAERERARLAAIVESSHDAIVSIGTDLRFTSFNRAAEVLYGYRAEEVLGKSSEPMIPPEATGESRSIRHKILAGGEVHRYETQRLRKDGSLIDVEITAFPLLDGAGTTDGAASIAHDITQRKHSEHALAKSEERYREILETTPDGVTRLDVANRVDYVNARMAEILGYSSPEELLGWPIGELIDPEERQTSEQHIEDDRVGMTGRVIERRLRRKDRQLCWARISTTALSNDDGSYRGALAIMSDITASKAQETELRATERFLTAVTDSMAEGMYAVDEGGQVTYMNQAAEKLLGWTKNEIGERTMHETVHYQHEDGSPHSAAECPLLGAMRTGTPVRVEDDVFTRRDGRLLPIAYSSAPITNDARGLVVVFRDVSARRAEEQRRQEKLDMLSWVGRIRDALDEERFVLHAQPIIDLRSRDVVAHELLLRMVDRDGEIVAPGKFLPAAEQFGLIEEIDRWVLVEAIKLAKRGLKVYFNISGKSLGSRALIDDLDRALRETGAKPALLVCEITETALADSQAVAEAFVNEIVGLGCEIALDDFGTGYGGFKYLKSLPVTFLKIDMDFVRDLVDNAENQHLVKAIVNLAKGFGRKTIAEGVEDEATLELLLKYGVDYAQGFAIGWPAPLAPQTQTRGATRGQAATLSGA